jgi:hypothetical protein
LSLAKKLPAQDCATLIAKLQKQELGPDDTNQVIQWLELAQELVLKLQEKDVTIRRLRQWISGERSEQRKPSSSRNQKSSQKPPSSGHGRLGTKDYPNAPTVPIDCTQHQPGDRCCSECDGTLKEVAAPSIRIQVTGNPPLQAKKLAYQRLRCNKCLRTVTAKPDSFEKYDERAKATLALLKYESALPFYRLEQLQSKLGIPLPDATQWTLMESLADDVYPIYQALIKQAATAELFHVDDTGVRILSLIKENKNLPKQARSGQHTTGLIAQVHDQLIYLYFHGRKHAGENMAEILGQRPDHLKAPIQMSDALAANTSHDFATIIVRCMTHARRYFVEIEDLFPDECKHVIQAIGQIYKHDREAKELTPEERLAYHQERSQPIMRDLKTWLKTQFDDRLVEPNSVLGKAFRYMLKHWKGLTEFLRRPGVPLDNNIVERALKTSVLQRKNALFFRTEFGALVGSILTSLIKTCTEAGENPLDYLVALQEHKKDVRQHPDQWLPWTFRNTLSSLVTQAA